MNSIYANDLLSYFQFNFKGLNLLLHPTVVQSEQKSCVKTITIERIHIYIYHKAGAPFTSCVCIKALIDILNYVYPFKHTQDQC